MPKAVQSFGVFTILGTLFTAVIIGSVSWIASQASHVPELQVTINHLASSIESSTATQGELVKEIKVFKETNMENRATAERIMALQTYKIQTLEQNCLANSIELQVCRAERHKSGHINEKTTEKEIETWK